jgi:hypothetical protein
METAEITNMAKVIKEVGVGDTVEDQYYTIKKKGLSLSLKPLMVLVAGEKFEPPTFGL